MDNKEEKWVASVRRELSRTMRRFNPDNRPALEHTALVICQEKYELIRTAMAAAVTVPHKQFIITFIIICSATDKH